MVYTVVFTIELRNEKDAQLFLEGFRPLHEYVRDKERGTLSYEIHQCVVNSLEDSNSSPTIPGSSSVLHPRKFMVLERYHTKQDFTDIHLKSAAFATFFEFVKTLEVVETNLKEYDSRKIEI